MLSETNIRVVDEQIVTTIKRPMRRLAGCGADPRPAAHAPREAL